MKSHRNMIKRKYGRHVSLKKKSRKSGRVVHKTSKNTLRKGRRGTRSHHIHGGTCPLNTFNCSWPQMWGGNDDDAYFKYRVTPILPNETTASKTPFNRDATIQNIDKLVSDVKRCIYHFPEKNIINSNNYSCIGIVIPFTDKIVSEKQRVSDIFIKYQLDDTMFNDFWNLYAIHLTKNEMGTSELRKRKRLCMDILENILEEYPKPKKVLYEEIGIELWKSYRKSFHQATLKKWYVFFLLFLIKSSFLVNLPCSYETQIHNLLNICWNLRNCIVR